MPTVITHTAVPLALGLGLGRAIIPRRLLVAGAVAAMIPDLDVVGLKLGIAYADTMGHRGVTHSLFFALIAGALAFVLARRLGARPVIAGVFVFVSCASHGLLDMCTNGGLGIAFFWPCSHTRYFLPWHFIEVSPLSAGRVFSARGLQVLYSELRGIWLPCLLVAGTLIAARWGRDKLQAA